jgi:hypothetical protein
MRAVPAEAEGVPDPELDWGWEAGAEGEAG